MIQHPRPFQVTWNHTVTSECTPAEAVGEAAQVMRGTIHPLRLEVQPLSCPGDGSRARMVVLDGANLAAVRAALAWYQQRGFGDPQQRPKDITDLASEDGRECALDEAGLARLECALDDAVLVVASPVRAIA